MLAVSAAGLLASCGGGGAPSARHESASTARAFAGSELRPVRPAADFALRDQSGRLVRLSAQRGRLVLVTFLYTHCADVCPLIASNLGTALRLLGPTRSQVRVLAVSVDPKGDTPAAVRRFIRIHRLPRQFRYLTGRRRELEAVWNAYHVAASHRGPQALDHSAYTLLVDGRGRGRLIYDADAGARAVRGDLRRFLATGTDRSAES